MLSFYQAYQAYERRWMRGELAVSASRRAYLLCLCASFLLRLADRLARAGNALQRRYDLTASPFLSSPQEKS